ncbi:hypothetical protein AZE42_09794 [Rhizopogon vesiculosus]|uniref:CCHC-type domain-containing protein n=1 Tax=Rhizopogon vesiculosus TaxID=180088 RepID=A0A1J8QGS7_9AGAM|nr:hypothetical protein AZE42_09794 [Rhizopogon vesiculosus]
MSTLPITTDTLPNNVPKLDVKGTNWAIFSLQFQIAVEAKELWMHFDGAAPRPVGTPTAGPNGTTVLSPPDPDDLAKWQKSEILAKHLLTQHIPDSTALHVWNLTDVATMWTEIVREYTEKGTYAQTDLHTKFLESKCPSGGNVCQFLDDLCMKRDELAAVGVQIDEKDYHLTIIQSLPNHLASFASGQLATAHLYSAMKTIDPDILISLIIEELECRGHRDSRPTCSARMHDDDKAVAVTQGEHAYREHGAYRGSRRGGHFTGYSRQRPPCWNCSSREHFKADCPQPDRSMSTLANASGSAQGSAHAVADMDSDEDSIFAVDMVSDCGTNSTLPDLLTLSSDDDIVEHLALPVDDDDWFSEVGEEDEIPDCEVSAYASNSQEDAPVVELYNSGSTRHIFPYCEKFATLADIPPKTFVATNKQHFAATAMGDMVIDIPNGADMTKLTLTEVLFSPEVSYTLMSIGRLNKLGYSTTFMDGTCVIRDPAGAVIGRVAKSGCGLYRVVHDGEPSGCTNAALETVTVMELHRRLGHIAPSAACRLAEHGLVTGLKIDLSSGEHTFCKSCVYAKATRKPIAKERTGEHAQDFAGEVHTDLWGPAPVETLRGK